MNLGDLEDSLLNLGKEKAKGAADQLLGEDAETGGVEGTIAGYGKDLLDNAFGGHEEGNSEDSASDDQGAQAEDNTADDDASDDSDNDSADDDK